MKVAEIRPGLWRWTAPHPAWRPDSLWPREVGSVYAETRDALVIIDPLVPENQADQFWRALDRGRERVVHLPVCILLTCAWHRRSADEVAGRYDGDVWQPGETLPVGVEVVVFEDTETRWREAVFAFPTQGVVVFGDVVEGDGEGGLGGCHRNGGRHSRSEREGSETTFVGCSTGRSTSCSSRMANPSSTIHAWHCNT